MGLNRTLLAYTQAKPKLPAIDSDLRGVAGTTSPGARNPTDMNPFQQTWLTGAEKESKKELDERSLRLRHRRTCQRLVPRRGAPNRTAPLPIPCLHSKRVAGRIEKVC